MTRPTEAIALAEDLPAGHEARIEIAYEYRIGDPAVDARAAAARLTRVRLERERRELVRDTEEMARTLVSRYGVSVRDAAVLAGVSMQRVSQLTAPTRAAGRRATATRA